MADTGPAQDSETAMSAQTANPDRFASELFTDLYEMTMIRAYHALGMNRPAAFSLFVRRLPATRNLLIACGVEPALEALERVRFSQDSLDYLAALGGRFPDDFLRWLQDFRFSGDVFAMAEGTPVFPHEPILELVAPLAEAQLLETLLMNLIGSETMLASKAYRVVAAADGRTVLDFGSRRAHGTSSALAGARAFHVAGVAATSNLLAGRQLGLPVAGTMAHSFVSACDSELEAFRLFSQLNPGTTLLVDTYDTLEGVKRVIALAAEQGDAFDVAAIRLDSGDLAGQAKAARTMLDEAGLDQVKIVASGGLGEERIAGLLAEGAPFDGFGVGTEMSVSGDAPSLDIVYKLTEYDGVGRVKLATGKNTLPGRKQVFRRNEHGAAAGDVIGRADEKLRGDPLLRPVMRGGERLEPAEPLAAARERAAAEIARLPEAVRGLAPADPAYPVGLSERLLDDMAAAKQAVTEQAAR